MDVKATFQNGQFCTKMSQPKGFEVLKKIKYTNKKFLHDLNKPFFNGLKI